MATIFLKSVSETGVGRVIGHLGTDCGLEARHADRVRPHAESLFEVVDVLLHRQHLEFPVVESEKDADADVVDARLHGPVEGRDAPAIIPLGAGGVNPGVGFAMVGFLE